MMISDIPACLENPQLKNVLWIEELQHEVDVRQYDIDGAELAIDKSRTYLYLKVGDLMRVWTRLEQVLGLENNKA